MEYLRWKSDKEDGFCAIRSPVVDDEPLYTGQSLVSGWPDDVTARMKDEYPDDIELADNLYYPMHPIVSERIVGVLKNALPEGSVEFLPVTIINHKGRAEEAPYYILHALEVIDCIDQEASEVDWNPLAPDRITDCMGLVFIENSIPDNSKLFRLKHWGSVIIIRSDLAEQLESEGFTGLYFPEAEGYDGIG